MAGVIVARLVVMVVVVTVLTAGVIVRVVVEVETDVSVLYRAVSKGRKNGSRGHIHSLDSVGLCRDDCLRHQDECLRAERIERGSLAGRQARDAGHKGRTGNSALLKNSAICQCSKAGDDEGCSEHVDEEASKECGFQGVAAVGMMV